MAYAYRFSDARELFGAPVTPSYLVHRVRSFGWRGSYAVLSSLAAKVFAADPASEQARRLTLDPLMALTGTAPILAHARAYVQRFRNELVIAHEEVLSFLQHLVLLEGNQSEDAPAPPEVSLWLACAASFLGRWEREAVASGGREQLIAHLGHVLRFNSRHDTLRELVRSYRLFALRPRAGVLSDPEAWSEFQAGAFGQPFEQFFESVLGVVGAQGALWGEGGEPVLHKRAMGSESYERLKAAIGSERGAIRAEIEQRLHDGLPHAPVALLHRPLVELESGLMIGASPWVVQHQVRFAPYVTLLKHAKRSSRKDSPEVWTTAFGQQLEEWCRQRAAEASQSPFCRVRFQLPKVPGGVDEVEDVVLIEGRAVVLFSVKGKVMDAKSSRDAISPDVTMAWYEKFFFEEKEGRYRAGAARLLNERIRSLRSGAFEHLGVKRNARILPVVVTYDTLCDHDIFYRWLEERLQTLGLLLGPNIAPLALCDVEDFETLMAHAASGRSVVGLLRRREGVDQYRRLDQILAEHPLMPSKKRLPSFERDFRMLQERLSGNSRLNQLDGSPLPAPSCSG